MLDRRFYEIKKPLSAAQIAHTVSGRVEVGDENHLVSSVAPFLIADENDLTFLRAGTPFGAGSDGRGAGICLATPDMAKELASTDVRAIISVTHPQAAFVRASQLIAVPYSAQQDQPISPLAQIAPGVQIDAGAIIGAHAVIGKGTHIGPHAVIGCGVEIGANCDIGAGAALSFCQLGNGVKIFAGAVIGSSGLGTASDEGGLLDMPHFGIVEIADAVTLGANSTIDRGVFGATRIGARCKIDNLVHIAHNVQMGEDCALAALCGISGSVTIGNNVLMGGRVGIVDHVTIADGVRLSGASVVTKSIGKNEIWGGHPARPLSEFLRTQAQSRRVGKT